MSHRRLHTALCLGLLAIPSSAAANGEGHADRNHNVTFHQANGYEWYLNTQSCKLVKKGPAKYVVMTKVPELTESSSLGNLQCRSNKPECVVSRTAAGAVTRGPSGNILPFGGSFDDDVGGAIMNCALGLIPDHPFAEFNWSNNGNTDHDLSSGSGNQMAKHQTRKEWTLDNGTKRFDPWETAEEVGLCRVRFFGADFLGTIQEASFNDTYRWSSSAHKYVTTTSTGSGSKCQVRLSPEVFSANHNIMTFKHYDVVRMPQGKRWSTLNPSSIPSDAIPIGMHRNKVVYACKEMSIWQTPFNHTMGLKVHHREHFLGWFVEGSNKCYTSRPYDKSVSSTRILRQPI